MCGIVGAVSIGALPSEEAFERASLCLRHRGPDDCGSIGRDLADCRVRVYHRRLSIIDLSPAARQPLANETGTVHVVFNGEIYNYVEIRRELEGRHAFRSSSDTEAVVHLYEELGGDCFARLDGMFAIAIWDEDRRELVLARDRAGMKPLYYAAGGGTLLFASELKALRVLLPALALDLQSTFQFFDLGYVPHDRTIYQGVRKLEQGTCLRWREGTVVIRPFWTAPPVPGHPIEVEHEFAAKLSDAVRVHCRSDVELGVFLSGGLDSSCLVAAMDELGFRNIRTFSIGFPGMGQYDERPHAEAVASRFRTNHRSYDVTPDAKSVLPLLTTVFDEPFADASAIPTYYLAKIASEQVKVVLTGTGADDVLAGYRKYHLERLRHHVRWVPGFLIRSAHACLGLLPATRRTSFLEEILLARRFLRSLSESAQNRYLATLRPIGESILLDLFSSPAIERAAMSPEELQGSILRRLPHHPTLHEALVADFLTYLSGDLLVKEDRLMMHFSIEGRMPFLDAGLVDFCLSLPEEWLLHGGRGKHVLRRWAATRLPRRIIDRKKHGFGAPMAEWLRSPLRSVAEQAIEEAPESLFDRHSWRQLWQRHLRGRQDHSQALYNLIVFTMWARSNADCLR
ncbi:MAG: asparagine synthase (glutamine-hydrolyzing) [Acidobacteriota bacterium]